MVMRFRWAHRDSWNGLEINFDQNNGITALSQSRAETFAARHDAAEDREQDLVERLHHPGLLSRVGDGLGRVLKGSGNFPGRVIRAWFPKD